MKDDSKASIMEELKRIKDEIKAGKATMKSSYLIAAFDAILNLHERLSALEASA